MWVRITVEGSVLSRIRNIHVRAMIYERSEVDIYLSIEIHIVKDRW